MGNRLEGKVALVTGGSSGIGLATARRFAAEGATVYITGRRQAELDAAAAEIGPQAVAVRGDVSKLDDLDRLYAVIQERSGRLDVLFANAGSGEFGTLGSITPEHFDWIYNLNVRGTLFTVQKALPLMPDGASIVLNASNSHVQGIANFSVYSSSKAAVRAFARSWSTDLKSRRIRVNSISPGVVVTPAYRTKLGLDDAQIEQFTGALKESTPAGRAGTAEEIAGAVLFLASDESSYITGVDLLVDGGQTQV